MHVDSEFEHVAECVSGVEHPFGLKLPGSGLKRVYKNRLHKPTTLAPAFQHFIEASPLEAQSALQQPHEVETLGSGARKMLVHGLDGVYDCRYLKIKLVNGVNRSCHSLSSGCVGIVCGTPPPPPLPTYF